MDTPITPSALNRRRRVSMLVAAVAIAALCASTWAINRIVRPSLSGSEIRVTEVRRGEIANTISAAAAAPSGGELAAYLKGRYLVRFYSGNGYSEKHEIWLCTNGQFRSRFDGGGFTQGVASGAFEGGNVGTWAAQGNRAGGVLSLSASDGAQSRFEVRESSDALLLNGQKWLRGENSLCD